MDFFGCGYTVKHKNFICYSVYKFEDISLKIIPFFQQYKIIGEKYKDFKDFCIIAELIKNKTHLTKEGVDKIKLIKSGMNNNRYI